MNKKHLAMAALGVMAVFSAAAYKITEYKAAPAVALHIPATPDSLQKENPFKVSQLLNVRDWLPTPAETAGWNVVAADTAGRVKIDASANSPVLHTFTTRFRSERFAKGKLVLNSTARAVVKVNGESVVSKTEADSLPADSEASVVLKPENDNTVTVDILQMPDDKSIPDFSLEFVPDKEFNDVLIHGSASLPGRAGQINAMAGERTTGVYLSDNGKYVLTRFRELISNDETRFRASLTETATGKVISEDVNAKAFWMPGADALCYCVARNGKYDIYKQEIPSMKSTLLARGIPDNEITLSPDGRYLFYYDQVKDETKDNGKLHRYRTPDDRIPGDRDRNYIVRYDLKSHVAMPLTYGGASTSIFSFTRDGSKMLYASTMQTPDRHPFYEVSLIEMDMKTLGVDTIVSHDTGNISNAFYSPDGKQLFIMAGPDAFGGIGANYGSEPVGNDFDAQGYILNIADKKVRAVTREFNPTLAGPGIWNAVDGKVYLLGESGFNQYVYRLDPATGKIDRLESNVEFVRNFSIGNNEAQWLAYWGGGFSTDGEAWMLNLRSNKSHLIANPLKSSLENIEFGKMMPWKFNASDGTEIDGYICFPPEFDPQKKYPLIVYYYGGTSPSTASFYHNYSPQVFASRDYVVYVINPGGATGYGQEFSARHVNAWGKRTADEIIEGTKKFCAEHPFVDKSKIGCIGASYGGFMTQYLQTRTDIFAAAVSHAGISDVTSYWGEGFWGYSYNSVAAAKSYPWTNPELFTQQGSLFNADKIHTPLLLLHGTVDTNVPIGESIQLFNALKILGRDVEFITVQDENHVIQGFDNRLVWQDTIMAWFAKYLQNDPRWWNSLYGK
ncbi:MAG: S9 family peptidase [Candidatus Amulumruptor caecigallinarius]|nr:S9 family peptidase [Candidatus Amulumruptor caecigallinarius]